MASRLMILVAIIVLKILTPEGFGESFSDTSSERIGASTDFLMLSSAALGLAGYVLFRMDRSICLWSYFLLWNALLFFLDTCIVIDNPYELIGGFRITQILHLQLQIPEKIGYTFEMVNGIQLLVNTLLSFALIVRAIEYKDILLKRGKRDSAI